MRSKFSDKVESARIRGGAMASPPNVPYGAFELTGPCAQRLTIIVSDGEDFPPAWQHVSVSVRHASRDRLPNWKEMCFVKDLFFDEEENVIQYHPPRSEYVNNYRVLHLWKPPFEVARPPQWMIGVKSIGELP